MVSDQCLEYVLSRGELFMEEKKYRITLTDGTVLDNLKLNGNNYVADYEVTEDMFNGNLSQVIINDGEIDMTYSNMQLVHIAKYDDGYYFILRAMTKRELQDLKNRADIDYIAMMTDVDI